ncbi:hypothetical protein [Natrinema sp. H-ect4]|uniref:hypothetical protein n=1 Tax=Natrinema sp. H-ect4 TaxID=3242699 RepID=UPI0035A92D23
MLGWFVKSKTRYLAYLFVWKLADIHSTFLVAEKYGWRAEVGFTMIGQLGPQFGHVSVSWITVGVMVATGYLAYRWTPVVAEGTLLFIPAITVGNLILLVAPLVGSLWNVGAMLLIPALYISRGFRPIWFEWSPTRDELIENYKTLKSWKAWVRGEQDAV